MALQRISSDTPPPVANCTMVVLGIAALVSAVVIGLGTFKLFGPLASPGFLGSVAGGGTLCLIFIGTLTLIAIHNCKSHNARSAQIKHDLGQEAIQFARQKLAEHLEIQADQEIARFRSLFNHYRQAFEAVLKKHTPDWLIWGTPPGQKMKTYDEKMAELAKLWSQAEVQQAANDLLQIGYALSTLSSDEADIYSCALAYRLIRASATAGLCVYPKNPREDLYYEEGTIEYRWRMLYNAHCDLIHSQTDTNEVENDQIKILLNLTRKDEETLLGGRTFHYNPDPLR